MNGAAAASTALLSFTHDQLSDARRALAEVGDGTITEIAPAEVPTHLRDGGRALRACDVVGIAGEPPADGIGYGLAPLVVGLARPRRVDLIDTTRRTVRRVSAPRFLAEALPTAVGQTVGSAVAVAAQRMLGQSLITGPPAPAPPGRGDAERVLYLRALVGVPTAVGGSITHSHGVIRAMRQIGLDVDPLTTDPAIAATAAAEDRPPCDWRLVRIPRATRAMPASLALGGDLTLAAHGRASARDADLIYQRHARFSIVGALLARLTGRPLFLEYNGSEAVFEASYDATPLAGQLALCEEATLAAATRIIVMSEVDRRNLIDRGVPDEQIVLNPNGVDADQFARGGGGAVRDRLGVDDGQTLFGFVGSFGPWHGSPALADAFGRLIERRPDARLLLVGDGPDRAEVERVLAASGAGGRAFLVGKVAPGEVPAHLDACDVLVSPHIPMPNQVEFFGSPTKLFEYMAAGKGIVASRLGQIGEVLEHEQTALMVEPGDIDQLAAGMERLMDDEDLRSRLGQAARTRAVERHSWRANAQRVVAAYRDWAAGQR